jgi:hypothetical protein
MLSKVGTSVMLLWIKNSLFLSIKYNFRLI